MAAVTKEVVKCDTKSRQARTVGLRLSHATVALWIKVFVYEIDGIVIVSSICGLGSTGLGRLIDFD